MSDLLKRKLLTGTFKFGLLNEFTRCPNKKKKITLLAFPNVENVEEQWF